GAQVFARAMRGFARVALEGKHLIDYESSRSIAQIDELGREGKVHFAMIARSSKRDATGFQRRTSDAVGFPAARRARLSRSRGSRPGRRSLHVRRLSRSRAQV